MSNSCADLRSCANMCRARNAGPFRTKKLFMRANDLTLDPGATMVAVDPDVPENVALFVDRFYKITDASDHEAYLDQFEPDATFNVLARDRATTRSCRGVTGLSRIAALTRSIVGSTSGAPRGQMLRSSMATTTLRARRTASLSMCLTLPASRSMVSRTILRSRTTTSGS